MGYRFGLASLLFAALTLSCSSPQGQPPVIPTVPAAPSRTLIVAHRYEPGTLAPKVLQSQGPMTTTRLFNAALTLLDIKDLPEPYLAAALPQLNTDSWRLFPDGRMETTYRLHDHLTWQDGAPLTADDFVCALQVYQDPGLGGFISAPQNQIDTVLAPDPQTLVIAWNSLNPTAGTLTFGDLDPLPSHLLASAFSDYTAGRIARADFLNLPVWSTAYIGAGPFRLDQWQPGLELDGTAFDGHVQGRPRIDHLVVRFFVDENQTVSALLAGGTVDFACCSTLRFAQLSTLNGEWVAAGKGTAVTTLGLPVFLFQQLRPAYVGDPGMLDLRVRQALAHAIDRQALNDGLFDGLATTTETPVPPNVPFYPEVDRLMTKYPLNLGAAAELMRQAGYARGADGFFADAQGTHLHVDFAVQAGSEIQRMQDILSDSWKRAGFDVRPVVIAPQLFTQLETRNTLPGLGYAFFSPTGEQTFLSSEIPTAANGWTGNNRSGWASAEYDRLGDALATTLDPNERGDDIARMIALVSAELPGYALYYSLGVNAWDADLQGASPAEVAGFGLSFRGATPYWDIQNWSFR